MATQTSAVIVPHTPPSTKLRDQATTAALYVTKNERNKSSSGNRFLDGESRISPAGAAASLKYASPKDLPSFPSTGLRNDDSAAGIAASIGWANQKSFEQWKPDLSSSAFRAALLAKDYKAPPPPWQPEQSASGAKAAVLAAKDGSKFEMWKPEASSTWGNSAANQAFRSDRSCGLSPQIDYGYTTLGRQGSLMAATGAMSGTRRRADSTPTPKATYPDEANAAANALSAATHANNPSRKTRTEYSTASGTSPFTNMPKEMFTSHPPVAPEVNDKRRSDVLHASAVAMAKQMYNIQQQNQIDQTARAQRSAGKNAAVSAHGRSKSSSNTIDEVQPMRHTSLQEAAQRLAQERLAKLHDERAQNREYRNYYGEDFRPTSRLSIRGRVRRRASSDSMLDEDRVQSQRIRAQMSLFSSNLSQVDAKKRQKDRDALMAAAQRNVTASLHGMDEKVFKDTGKILPSMLNEWEVKAQAAAQKNSDSRMENYGKINIGGGKFIDRSMVEAVAARNVQPVLDEINAKAEQERVRQAELKLEQDASRRSAEAQKNREREVREINRKLKEQDKEEERLRKEEEKAAKAEQKRVAKQEKKKSGEVSTAQKTESAEPRVVTGEVETGSPVKPRTEPANEERMDLTTEEPAQVAIKPEGYIAPPDMRTSMEMQTNERLEGIIKEGERSPTSLESSRGVKGWLKTKFSRRQSKSQKSDFMEAENDKDSTGGPAMAEAGDTDTRPPKTVVDEATVIPASIENKDISEKAAETVDENVGETLGEERLGRSKRRATSISPVSTLEERIALGKESTRDEEFDEARDHFDNEVVPPPTFAITKPTSPIRDSKFHEEM